MTAISAMQSLQQAHPKSKMAYHAVEIPRPAQAIYDVLTDFESYPDFVPNMRKAQVLASETGPFRDTWTVGYELSLIKRVSYELIVEGVVGRTLSWRLLRGDFMRENVGGWDLEALPNGHTRATLYVGLVTKGWVPSGIINSLASKTCPQTVRAFAAEVERRTTA